MIFWINTVYSIGCGAVSAIVAGILFCDPWAAALAGVVAFLVSYAHVRKR